MACGLHQPVEMDKTVFPVAEAVAVEPVLEPMLTIAVSATVIITITWAVQVAAVVLVVAQVQVESLE